MTLFNYGLGNITRTEEIKLDFVKVPFQDLTTKQKRLLKKLNAEVPSCMIEDDKYGLHYFFDIYYLNGIELRLGYIEELLDSGFVLEAVSGELNHVKCLAQDVFAKIERIEGKYRLEEK